MRRFALSRLLLGQVADNWELVHLALIRFQQQDNPDNQGSQSDQHVEWRGQEN
jgi:hypothetical protein